MNLLGHSKLIPWFRLHFLETGVREGVVLFYFFLFIFYTGAEMDDKILYSADQLFHTNNI